MERETDQADGLLTNEAITQEWTRLKRGMSQETRGDRSAIWDAMIARGSKALDAELHGEPQPVDDTPDRERLTRHHEVLRLLDAHATKYPVKDADAAEAKPPSG